MADFLTRLANRTLGLAPLARPLIPPLFAAETFAGPEAALEEVATEPSSQAAALLPAEAEPESPADLSLPPGATASPTARSVQWRQPRVRREETRPPARAEGPEVAPSTAAGDATPRVAAPTSPPLAARSGTAGGESGDAGLLLPRNKGLHVTAGRALQPIAYLSGARLEQPGAASPQRTPEVALSTEAGDEALLMPPVPPQPAAVATVEGSIAPPPAAASDVPRRAEPPPASGPPTIAITIGRVEVRAVQAPAQPRPRPAAPPAPAISLEEYLRRQYGGKP